MLSEGAGIVSTARVHEGLPILYISTEGRGQGCPLLRASSDHRFIVGALRARREPGRSPPIPETRRPAIETGPPHPPVKKGSASCARSLSDIAIRHEAKKGQADSRPQAPKNRRRIRWNTVRIFLGREQSRCLALVCRSRTVNVGQAPRPSEPVPTGGAIFRLGPLIARHSLLSFS